LANFILLHEYPELSRSILVNLDAVSRIQQAGPKAHVRISFINEEAPLAASETLEEVALKLESAGAKKSEAPT
jgi:hypothetical protein